MHYILSVRCSGKNSLRSTLFMPLDPDLDQQYVAKIHTYLLHLIFSFSLKKNIKNSFKSMKANYLNILVPMIWNCILSSMSNTDPHCMNDVCKLKKINCKELTFPS